MWATMEMRWFYGGTLPPEVMEWYQGTTGVPEAPAARVDHYLRLMGTDALGIKLRQGRIEVKQRRRQCGVSHVHRRVAGRMEHWYKWSFELSSVHRDLTNLIVPSSAWIAVQKERQLCTYQVATDREALVVSAFDGADRGCAVELCVIHAHGRRAWSFAFEAFGDEPTLQENLLRVARHVFAAAEPPVFEASASYGYPKWLQRMNER